MHTGFNELWCVKKADKYELMPLDPLSLATGQQTVSKAANVF